MCSILIILNLLHKLSEIDISPDDIDILFSMLCFKPGPCDSWDDLNFLLSFIPKECRKKVANVLVKFINAIMPFSSDLQTINWLYLIPLVHIFQKKTKPFKDPTLTSKEIIWFENCGIELGHIINDQRRSALR